MYFAIDLFCVCEIANLFFESFLCQKQIPHILKFNFIYFSFFQNEAAKKKGSKTKEGKSRIFRILFLHISSNWIRCNIRLTFLDNFQISNTWKIDVSVRVSLKENNKRDFIDGLEIQSWVFAPHFSVESCLSFQIYILDSLKDLEGKNSFYSFHGNLLIWVLKSFNRIT